VEKEKTDHQFGGCLTLKEEEQAIQKRLNEMKQRGEQKFTPRSSCRWSGNWMRKRRRSQWLSKTKNDAERLGGVGGVKKIVVKLYQSDVSNSGTEKKGKEGTKDQNKERQGMEDFQR